MLFWLPLLSGDKQPDIGANDNYILIFENFEFSHVPKFLHLF